MSRGSRSRSSIGRATTIGACRRARSRPASPTSRARSARSSRRPDSTFGSGAGWARPATSRATAPACGRRSCAGGRCRPRRAAFSATREVDDLRWLSLAEAADQLSRDTDREVLERFARGAAPTRTVLLVRHGSAGSSSVWSGDDRDRPLDACGIEQADELVRLLSRFEVGSILSADILRCTASVQPLADALALEIQPEPLLSAVAYPGREEEVVALVRAPGRRRARRRRLQPGRDRPRPRRPPGHGRPLPDLAAGHRAEGLDLGAHDRRGRPARRRRLPRAAAAAGLHRQRDLGRASRPRAGPRSRTSSRPPLRS